MGLIALRLENNGDVIEISPYLPKNFFRQAGLQGMGVAPTRLNIKEGAGPGGRHRNTKRLTRTIDLPLTIFGEDTVEIETQMRRLARLLQDRYTPATLYATYTDGREVFTQVHYAGGADPQFGVDSDHRSYAKMVLALRAPNPYWTQVEAQQQSLVSANTGRGLIKNASLIELSLSSSQTIGTFIVENDGDVDAYPIWTIRGPGDSFAATRVIDGASFSYTAAISNGNPITINTKTKKVVDSTGVNKYGSLGTAPKLFTIPPGQSTIQIVMTGTDSTSLVTLFFQPMFELVFA